GDYRTAIAIPSQAEIQRYLQWEAARSGQSDRWSARTSLEQERIQTGQNAMKARLDRLGERGDAALQTVREGLTLTDPYTVDDRYWAAAAAIITVLLLYNGRYGLIQGVSTALVVSFTFITIGNVYALQTTEEWKI